MGKQLACFLSLSNSISESNQYVLFVWSIQKPKCELCAGKLGHKRVFLNCNLLTCWWIESYLALLIATSLLSPVVSCIVFLCVCWQTLWFFYETKRCQGSWQRAAEVACKSYFFWDEPKSRIALLSNIKAQFLPCFLLPSLIWTLTQAGSLTATSEDPPSPLYWSMEEGRKSVALTEAPSILQPRPNLQPAASQRPTHQPVEPLSYF